MTSRITRLVTLSVASAALVALAGPVPATGASEATYVFDLTGAEVVPGPGDPDGSGTVVLSVDRKTESICFDITVEGVEPLVQGEIRRGAPGEDASSGLVLFDRLHPGTSKCPYTVGKGATKALLNEPGELYLEVYNAEFPDGALRGQLPARK